MFIRRSSGVPVFFLYIFSVLLSLMGKHGANFRYPMALCGELDGW